MDKKLKDAIQKAKNALFAISEKIQHTVQTADTMLAPTL